jgi:hypothetical protein
MIKIEMKSRGIMLRLRCRARSFNFSLLLSPASSQTAKETIKLTMATKPKEDAIASAAIAAVAVVTKQVIS